MEPGLSSFMPLIIVTCLLVWGVVRSRKKDEMIVDDNGNDVRRGLGGWLFILGIAVVLTPLKFFTSLYSLYMPIFTDGLLSTLGITTTSLLGIYFWGEAIINIVLFFVSIKLMFLFFGKQKIFLKFFVWYACISFAMQVLSFIVGSISTNNFSLDEEIIAGFIRALFGVMVWVPYILFSKRVKATFIK